MTHRIGRWRGRERGMCSIGRRRRGGGRHRRDERLQERRSDGGREPDKATIRARDRRPRLRGGRGRQRGRLGGRQAGCGGCRGGWPWGFDRRARGRRRRRQRPLAPDRHRETKVTRRRRGGGRVVSSPGQGKGRRRRWATEAHRPRRKETFGARGGGGQKRRGAEPHSPCAGEAKKTAGRSRRLARAATVTASALASFARKMRTKPRCAPLPPPDLLPR